MPVFHFFLIWLMNNMHEYAMAINASFLSERRELKAPNVFEEIQRQSPFIALSTCADRFVATWMRLMHKAPKARSSGDTPTVTCASHQLTEPMWSLSLLQRVADELKVIKT